MLRGSADVAPRSPIRLVTASQGSGDGLASVDRTLPFLGVSSLDLAGAFGLRPLPGNRATRDGAVRAARGDQGNGGDWATALPSQSVEKVVPEATGEGDGLTSASGPGIAPGSNSPDWAFEMVGGFLVPATPLSRGGTGSEHTDVQSVTARRDGTPSPSTWVCAGLQNQAPGVRLLPAVPDSRGAAA